MNDRWYDEDAGPLVRPYTVTGGRTGADPRAPRFDLVARVVAEPSAGAREADPEDALLGGPARGPEHVRLLELCREESPSVAELAARADLPVGVVRVLLGDLVARGRVRVVEPVAPVGLPRTRVLREVIDGLRAL
ncbi:DUF742 domain-containing protein [Streptomyces sp. BI20]|uniref:DUF742 domain-containing protein n=1 Tax=Streptomyces sp. BI20 TaxID=3403460 RepID=UPI003C70D517